MSIKLFSKTLISAALAATLSACGGGGSDSTGASTGSGSTGSGSTGTTTTLSFSLSNSSLTMDENTQSTISTNVNYNGSASLSYSYDVTTEGASAYSNISITGDTITVNANDVDQDVTYSVDVTLTDGTLSDTKTFQVSLKDLDMDNDGLSISLDSSLIINEGQSALAMVDVTYDSTEEITYQVEYSQDVGITDSSNANSLTFEAPELDASVDVVATITATAGDATATDQVTISLNNISGSVELESAELWASGAAFTMNEFDEFLNIYTHAAYLSGGIKMSEKGEFSSSYEQLKTSASSQSESTELADLTEAIGIYMAGDINSKELMEKTKVVQDLATEHSNSIASLLNQVAGIAAGSLPEIELNKFSYNEQYQVFTSLIGNDSMGSFNGDTWEFSGSYEFMNTLVTVLGNTTQCEAE